MRRFNEGHKKRKGGHWPPFLLPRRYLCLAGSATVPFAAAVVATLDPVTLAIEASIDPLAPAIEAPIHAVALAIETLCQPVAASRLGASRLPVEAPVDPVAPGVEPILDSITAVVEPLFNPVAGVRKRGAADGQQSDAECNCLSCVHIDSPLCPCTSTAFSTYNGVHRNRLTGILSG
jgi:hypothetical protein